MNASVILAAIMLISLVIYSLLGGADYGAGFWDLVCSGPRKQGQRDLIAKAIQPVWETNHIWLILLVVLMFSGFAPAFSAISVALAAPVFLILLGIVLRGSSYCVPGLLHRRRSDAALLGQDFLNIKQSYATLPWDRDWGNLH